MSLPDYNPMGISAGVYEFTVKEVIEKRKHKDKRGHDFYTIKFRFSAEDEDGVSYSHIESFLSFDAVYRDLLLALGAETNEKGQPIGSTVNDPVGSTFTGEIQFKPDRKDPEKSWPRIVSVDLKEETRPSNEVNNDDIPF